MNLKIITGGIKLHEVYQVYFRYMHGDADGYETKLVLQTGNIIDVFASIFVYHSYANLYPNGRGGSDDYPVIWEALVEEWPYDYNYDIQSSIDSVEVFYYINGVKNKVQIEYSDKDLEFISSFGSMTNVAGGRTNSRKAAITDYDWSQYVTRITDYCNSLGSNKYNVTIFDDDYYIC